MVVVTVQKTYGVATARVRVWAASIERALRLTGEGARIVFPIDAELFFAAQDTEEGIEALSQVQNRKVIGLDRQHRPLRD